MKQTRILSVVTISLAALLLGGCAHWPATRQAEAAPDLVWQPPSPPSPPLVWVPAGSFRKAQRGPEDITAIVIHTTEGRFVEDQSFEENQARNFRGNINYFRNNPRNVSAHFVVGPYGEVCHMVNESDIAATQTYYNNRAIGIECAGWGDRPETWTPELLDSLVNLVAYLCVKWEVPAYKSEGTAHEGPNRVVLDGGAQRFTGQGIVGHYQIQPWNKSDPGPHFPWEDFTERVRERIREFGAEPIALPTADEETAEVADV